LQKFAAESSGSIKRLHSKASPKLEFAARIEWQYSCYVLHVY